MKNEIIVENLTKKFVRQKIKPGIINSFISLFNREKIEKYAVNDISFSINEGEIVGFLGPNGAGKTTTLKMLSGIIYPTSGEAKVAGYIPWERKDAFKKNIGIVMGQKQQLIWDLPAANSFELLIEIFGLDKKISKQHVNSLVQLLEVQDLLNIQIRQLSLGQRMKLEIIGALLHKPKILFLDEPTLGLDVVSQQNIRQFFKRYNEQEKTTILLTSHYMEDIKALCDRVIIINEGSLIYDNSLDKLIREKVSTKKIKISLYKKPEKELAKYGQILQCTDLYYELAIDYDQSAEIAKEILNNFSVEDITIEEPEAQDVIRDLFQKS